MPFDRSQPLYLQIIDALSARIADGTWAQGAAIPSEPKLARSLGVSQGTVRKALAQMAVDGLVDRRQGVGTFVAAPDPYDIAPIFVDHTGAPLPAELRNQVLLSEPLPPRAATALGQDAGASGWCIEQLSCLANTPALVERIYVAADMMPDLTPLHLPAPVPELWHRLTGRATHRLVQHTRPMSAPKHIAWALDVAPGAAILHITQTSFDLSGQAIDHRDIYNAPGTWRLRSSMDVGKKW